MSAPAPARPTFPNFTQLGSLLPGWLWALLRYVVLGLALAMAGLLLQSPALGLTLFWGLAVPSLPLVFLFAPGIWRNLCPLASSNQLPRRLGLAMGLTRRSLSLGLAYPVGMAALLGFIVLRKLLFNHSPAATALLIVGAMLLAFVGGILFKGKSGWCSTVCPLLPVQRLLGQTAFVQVANTQCSTCVSCAKNCYDFNPGIATLADVNDEDPRYAGYRRVFAMLFPGLVLGFYLVRDLAPELAPALVPGLASLAPAGPAASALAPSHGLLDAALIAAKMALFMLGSLALFGLLDKLFGRTRNRVPLFAALLGFNLYYWHAAPLIAATFGKLALLTGIWPELTLYTYDIAHISSAATLVDTLGGVGALKPAALFGGASLAVYLMRATVALLSLGWLLRSIKAERAYLRENGGMGAPGPAVVDISRLQRKGAAAAAAPVGTAGSVGGDTIPQSLLDQYDGDPIPPQLIAEHRARRAASAEPAPDDGRVWASSAFAHLAQSQFAPWTDGPPTGFGTTGFGTTGFGNTGFGSSVIASLDDPRPAARAQPAGAPGEPALLLAPEGRKVALRVGQTLLDALESCGAPIHPGCRAGSCGADAVAIHDGSACLGSMSSDERATLTRLGHSGEGGVRLACVARLRKPGPVTVEVLPNTRLAAPAGAAKAGAAKVEIEYDRAIKRVLIVGNGVAGLTAAETVRAHHPDCEIHIVSRERQPSYQRIALARLFIYTTDPAKLSLKADDWYLEQRIHCWLNTRVSRLDTTRQTITLGTGEVLPYDRLILATGAAAWVPNIEGFGLEGSFVLRQASDALALRNYVHRYSAKRAMVLGAGLLGIEAADALAQMNLSVTLVTPNEHLLERQVDREAGAMVAEHLRRRGIAVANGTSITGVPRSAIGRVSGLRLRQGKQEPEDVEADLLLVCTGTRADIALAKSAGLSTERGILVDTRMHTSAANVFACGDVAQTTSPMWGLWAPAAEQGRVAALTALGREARWEPREPITTLKLPGLSVRSAGQTQASGPAQMELVHRQAATPTHPGEVHETDRYTKLVTQRDADGTEQVIGAIIVGDDPDGDDILAAACEHTPTRKLGAIMTQRPWQRQRGQLSSAAAGAAASGRIESAQAQAAAAAAAAAAAMTAPLIPTGQPAPGLPQVARGASAAAPRPPARPAPASSAPLIEPLTASAARVAPAPPAAAPVKASPRAAPLSAFGGLAPRSDPALVNPRLDPAFEAELDAALEARRDAAMDAALDADLKALSAKSRFGTLDTSLFGGLGDLDQSHFGAFNDQPAPGRSVPPSQRRR